MSESVTRRIWPLGAARWFDPVLAVSIATIVLVELFVRSDLSHSAFAPLGVILFCAPVAIRRRHPVAAACAQAAVVLATPGFDVPGSTVVPVMVLSYSCAAHALLRAAVLGTGVLFVAVALVAGPDVLVPVIFGVWGSFWLGRQVRLRRQLVSDLIERNGELEAQEDAFTHLSVSRERARIARELHDIVAHHLAVIVVQAGAGRLAAPGPAEQRAQRFATIRQSGGQALADMARLLDILQADDREHGLGRLRRMLTQAQAGGLDLRVVSQPSDLQLPDDVEDSAYSVLQEGLTNAMKHAPGAEVHVRLTVNDGHLEIDVVDHGGSGSSSLATSGSGLGLIGMRERVELLGGCLTAGPQAGGGWSLHVQLPLAPAAVIPAR
jgi:signal transduction histidine kinase